MTRHRVVVPPCVKKDLKEIVEYHYEVNKAYSQKLFGRLIERIRELETFPEKGRVVPELRDHHVLDYKELIEEPYRIVYRVFGEEVLLVALLDGRRDVEALLIRRLQRK